MDTRVVEASGDRSWNWPCLHLVGAERVEARITWVTEAGAEVVLPSSDVSASASAEAETVTVQIKYIPGEASATLASSLTGGYLDGNDLVIPSPDLSLLAGVYRADMRLLDENSVVRLAMPFLLSIEADAFSDDVDRAATLADLRMFLYDRMASENVVEGAQEFPDRLLFDGMCNAVRQYNRATPASSYNTCSFPAVDRFLEGSAAFVLDQYSSLLARNRLQVPNQADAEQRMSIYKDVAARYRSRWLGWIAEEKRILDETDGWGYE